MKALTIVGLIAGGVVICNIGGYLGIGRAMAMMELVERNSSSKLRARLIKEAENGDLETKFIHRCVIAGYNAAVNQINGK